MPALLKNPVFDDSVYAEPEESTKKATAGLLGEFPCVKPRTCFEIGSSFDTELFKSLIILEEIQSKKFIKCYNN